MVGPESPNGRGSEASEAAAGGTAPSALGVDEPGPGGLAELRARVEALEAEVARLSRSMGPRPVGSTSDAESVRRAARDAGTTEGAARTGPGGAQGLDDLFAVRGAGPAGRVSRGRSALSPDPGQWVGRLGTSLLLLGVAFAFQYGIDRGWLGPAVRVTAGLSLAVVLLGLGSRIKPSRPGLSRLLSGGGIVSGYLSVYAGFQLYALWPAPAAFAAMAVVTACALLVGWRDDEAVAATLGAAGGLATPFLLHAGDAPSATGLVLHTSVVAAGAAFVFARRGWSEVAWTLAIGGWSVLAVAAGVASGPGESAAVTLGAVLLALLSWWLPVAREVLAERSPALWPPTRRGLGPSWPKVGTGSEPLAMARLLSVLVPLAMLWTLHVAWDLDDAARGWSALAFGAATAALAPLLRGRGGAGDALASGQVVSSAVLVAFAVVKLSGPSTRPAFLAAEALAMHVLASGGAAVAGRARRDASAAFLGDLLFVAAAFWSLGRILDDIDLRAWSFGLVEVADLFVVACFGAAAFVRGRALAASANVDGSAGELPLDATSGERVSRERSLHSADDGVRYAVAAQAGLMLWLMDVLRGLPNGEAWVTASWFAEAVALVVAGLRFDSAMLRRSGALVMAATMAKLFLFDLDDVGAGWRIVVFLGFGVVLLGLGYAFPALLGRSERRERGPLPPR